MKRRGFLIGGSAAVIAAGVAQRVEAQPPMNMPGMDMPGMNTPAHPQSPPGHDHAPVQPGSPTRLTVPNGRTLPWREVRGVKVFHLIAEPVQNVFAPGLEAECWGYNGSTPGPVIEATEGDRVRIYVTNRLPEATTVHWHGLFLPSGMDGVGGLSQPYIQPGQTFRYEFPLTRPGTFMYHSHFDEMTQIALGAVGMFVVQPRGGRLADREFAIMLHEWEIRAGARRPNPMAMNDFNVLTMNGKCFPATEPLVVRRGERVRFRFGNLGPMDHHPIHIHGYAFKMVATDGGPIPTSAQWPETTVLVPVGATRDVEITASVPGDWAMHCHMTHHVMNQMGHEFPNTIGVDPTTLNRRMMPLVPGYMTMGTQGMGGMGEMGMPAPPNSIPMQGGPGPYAPIDMGGMFTIVKVRDEAHLHDEWYTPPPGTLAREATTAELSADHVET